MKEKVRFLGMDVHAETIAVAVAEANGEMRSLGTIANRAESIRKLVQKLGSPEQLRACYEELANRCVAGLGEAEDGVCSGMARVRQSMLPFSFLHHAGLFF